MSNNEENSERNLVRIEELEKSRSGNITPTNKGIVNRIYIIQVHEPLYIKLQWQLCLSKTIVVTVRYTQGDDITAACGQLAVMEN